MADGREAGLKRLHERNGWRGRVVDASFPNGGNRHCGTAIESQNHMRDL